MSKVSDLASLDHFTTTPRAQKLGCIARDPFAGRLAPQQVVPSLRDLYRRGMVDTSLIAVRSHPELRSFLSAVARAHG